jgi:hypothetical protein
MPRYYLSQISIEGFRGINNDGDPLVIKYRSCLWCAFICEQSS